MIWVIDTDVVVAAIRSRTGASAEVVRLALQGDVRIALSVAIMLEYESVTTRTEHVVASALSVEEILNVIDALAAVSVTVEPHFRWRPQLHDPGDEMILEAAVNAGASTIITFNRKDFGKAAAKFGIEIMLPSQALESLK